MSEDPKPILMIFRPATNPDMPHDIPWRDQLFSEDILDLLTSICSMGFLAEFIYPPQMNSENTNTSWLQSCVRWITDYLVPMRSVY
jgi:hypothetical protein